MGRRTDAGTESFGALLRRCRGRLGLTQEELADRAGLYPQQISQLERDFVRRPRSTTVEYLADALKLDAQERDAFAAAARGASASLARSPVEESEQVARSPVSLADAEAILATMPTDALPERGTLPTGSRMPLAPNPLFVGRAEELLTVARSLRGGDTTVALGQVVASTGLGGLGKTQLAVEFIHRYGTFFAGGVYWLSFASADEIPLQVAACAAPHFESRSLGERVRLVEEAWQSAVPRLLVFDNCEEESLLEAWRPASGGCRVLVTSRRSHWSPTLGVTALPLDLLPRPDSIALLRRYRPDVPPDDPRFDAIAEKLGDLPLALHLAGRYLLAYRAVVSLDEYLADLERPELIRHASLLGKGLDDSPSPTHHVQSLAQTFALCLGRLDRGREVDRVAIALLARIACLAPGEPVPRDLLAKTLEEVEPLLRADGLRRLGAVGLVEEGDGWLRLHRLLVHFVRRQNPDVDAQPAVARALIGCGDDAERGRLTGSALAAAIPHLVDVAGPARRITDERLTADLCTAAGQALHRAGDLKAVRPWYERALTIRECLLGSDHPDTAMSLNNLGELFGDEGDVAAATSLIERALAVQERVLGRCHPDTARSINNLGYLLGAQGELAAAKTLHERALAIWECTLGPEHPITAGGLNNLGYVLLAQGEHTAARPLLERALIIWEREMDSDHPDIAVSLHNLARLVYAQGELVTARPLFERALAIRERVLGLDHPRTAWSLNDLALLLLDQGDPAAARPLFERALAIHQRVLGPDHPLTVGTRRALAELAAEGDVPARGG